MDNLSKAFDAKILHPIAMADCESIYPNTKSGFCIYKRFEARFGNFN